MSRGNNVFKTKIRGLSFIRITLLILFIVSLFLPAVKQRAIDLSSLPLEIISSLTSDLKSIITYKFVAHENARLKNEVRKLSRQDVLLEELRQENQRLKKLLDFKDSYKGPGIAARVIAKDPSNASRGLVINKGLRHKVKPGNVVVAQGALAGRIIEAANDSSKALLINDMESSFAAFIQRTRDEGLVCGSLLGGLVMRYIDKDADIHPGDVVLALRAVPYGGEPILIASVEEVRDEAQGLSKYCLLKPAADLNKIEEVLVMLEK